MFAVCAVVWIVIALPYFGILRMRYTCGRRPHEHQCEVPACATHGVGALSVRLCTKRVKVPLYRRATVANGDFKTFTPTMYYTTGDHIKTTGALRGWGFLYEVKLLGRFGFSEPEPFYLLMLGNLAFGRWPDA